MFEDAYYSFEATLQRMLERVPEDVDKRAGSIIYDALAPAAAELAQTYIQLDAVLEVSFADTASGDYLTRRTSEFGVQRSTATAAVRKGIFYGANEALLDVPIGAKFGYDDLHYVVRERISAGTYSLLCDTVGIIGNQQYGTLLPLQHIPGLVRAELADVIVPGEDQETDEALRQRYYETVNEPAFGGNIADYEQTVNAMDGVGATKVFPVWMGGGTVKCVIIAADWSAPSSALVSAVQEAVDPTANPGKGYGTAPIGHVVTVVGVSGVAVDVATTVILAEGMIPGQVQEPIEAAVAAYLLGLRRTWATAEQIIVRVALIEAAILAVPGVIDVSDTMLGGTAANMTLAADEIPLIGTVTVNG